VSIISLDGCVRFMKCYVILFMEVDNDGYRR
jgi:hypothetical protein